MDKESRGLRVLELVDEAEGVKLQLNAGSSAWVWRADVRRLELEWKNG